MNESPCLSGFQTPRDIQWRHRRERREGGAAVEGDRERGSVSREKRSTRKTQKEEMRVRGGGPLALRETPWCVCV